MGFVDLESMQPIEPVPCCRLRAPYGQHLMLSYSQMDAHAEIPMHHHPHEQAGILLSGKLPLTNGDETRVVEPGSLSIILPKVNRSRDRGLHEGQSGISVSGEWLWTLTSISPTSLAAVPSISTANR